MTTLRVSVQDWEIPDTLNKIEHNIQRANELMEENKTLFKKVADAQQALKSFCEGAVKSQP